MRTKELALASLFASLTSLGAYIVIPLWPVPVTMQTFFLYLAIVIGGWKVATLSQVIYLAVGLAGLPVFAGAKSGVQAFLGPTGGYLIGFVFASLVGGLLLVKEKSRIRILISLIVATLIIYIFGYLYLSLWLHLIKGEEIASAFYTAFTVGILPFLIGDVLKMIAVFSIASSKRIKSLGDLP